MPTPPTDPHDSCGYIDSGLSPLSFLAIHHHITKTVRFPQEETLTTMVDSAISCCRHLNTNILKCEEGALSARRLSDTTRCRRADTVAVRLVTTLSVALAECIDLLTRLEDRLLYVRHMMVATRRHVRTMATERGVRHTGGISLSYHRENYKNLHSSFADDGPVNTVATFSSENRGLMLFVIHTLDQAVHRVLDLHKARRRSLPWFFSRNRYMRSLINIVVQCIGKVEVVLELVNFAALIAENRYCNNLENTAEHMTPAHSGSREEVFDVADYSKCNGDWTLLSLFADGIDLDSFPAVQKLNLPVFLTDMGSQYMPMVSTFFALLVHITAAHYHVNHIRNAYVRQILVGFMQLSYMINTESALNDCARFLKRSTTEQSKQLWEILDTGFVRVLNYFTLPHLSHWSTHPVKNSSHEYRPGIQ